MSRLDSFTPLLSLDAVVPLCVDRRKAKRLPCHPDTACLVTAAEATTVWAARVQNLSPGGVKLLLTGDVPGARIRTVRLHNPVRGFHCERLVRKVYTYSCPDGVVVLGVEFAKELSPEELEELL